MNKMYGQGMALLEQTAATSVVLDSLLPMRIYAHVKVRWHIIQENATNHKRGNKIRRGQAR